MIGEISHDGLIQVLWNVNMITTLNFTALTLTDINSTN